MRNRTISNSDDVIDSRDVIARISELESERETIAEDDSMSPSEIEDALTAWDEDDDTGLELARLKSLADEGESSADWTYGETLIRDSYFEEYAQQLAEDIGATNRNESWPNNCIDWEEAAKQLQMDYFSVEYGDETYWIRG